MGEERAPRSGGPTARRAKARAGQPPASAKAFLASAGEFAQREDGNRDPIGQFLGTLAHPAALLALLQQRLALLFLFLGGEDFGVLGTDFDRGELLGEGY